VSPLFLLHTNERPDGYTVRTTESLLRAYMWIYVRAKLAEGYKLHEILYSWTPITGEEGA
jgi:hypothetical protein